MYTYVEAAENFNYMQAKAEQQNSMESYVTECLIFAEKADVASKLQAMNEAENKGVFTKIKEAIAKCIAFIKKAVLKFFSRVEFFANNKKWLEKNKNIILKNKFKFDYTMYDYFGVKTAPGGITNMIEVKMLVLDYANHKEKLEDVDTCVDWILSDNGVKLPFNGKAADNGQVSESFSQYCARLFKGSVDELDFKATDMNLTTMYNYCLNYDNFKKYIEADQKVIERAGNDLNSTAMKYATTTAAGQTIDKTSGAKEEPELYTNPPKPEENNNSSQDNVIQTTAKVVNASAILSRVFGSISEAGIKADSDTSSSSGDGGATNNPAAAMKANANQSGDARDNNNQAANDDITAHDNAEGQNAEAQKIAKRASVYTSVTSTFITAKMTAAEKCYKDCIKLLKAHVDSYLAKHNDKDVAKTAETYNKPKEPTDNNGQSYSTEKK